MLQDLFKEKGITDLQFNLPLETRTNLLR